MGLTGDSNGAVIDTSRGKFPDFIKRAGGILNSEEIAMKFGSSDVYDGSVISLTSDKIPGSRGSTGKNNAR